VGRRGERQHQVLGRRGAFSGVHGTRIVHRAWLPDGPARGTVVLVHGINEHGGRYAHVAAHLVGHGWLAVAPDHRGHGLSGGRRAAVEHFGDWVLDLDTYVRMVLTDAPRPLFLLGHSLGGLIALVSALRNPDGKHGLILSSPSVMPAVTPGTGVERVARLLSRWVPNLPLIRLRLDAVSRDPVVVAAYRDDPLVHHGRVRVRTATEVLAAIAEVRRDIGTLRMPLLSLQGTRDLLVDPAAAAWVDRHAGSPDHALIVYDGLYHEVLNEPERGAVLNDITAWLERHADAAAPLDTSAASRR